jgi:hypothetical protein
MDVSKEDEMQGDIVTASRWLGASIVLASGIIVGGLRWARVDPVQAPATSADRGQSAPLDADVLRQSAETVTPAGVHACVATDEGERTPILDPLPDGSAPACCLDPPSEAEILRKLSRPEAGAAGTAETRRENVRVTVEKIGEKVDPCKVYPLAGPCQLVHCHYKCSVSFDETDLSDGPVPLDHRKARVEVVFIDKDHLRRCDGPEATTKAP